MEYPMTHLFLRDKAEGLLAKDRSGTSDPFAEIYLGGILKFKTRVVAKTLHPEWNETFTLHHPVCVYVYLYPLEAFSESLCSACRRRGVFPTVTRPDEFRTFHAIQGLSPETDSLDVAIFDHDKGVFNDSQVTYYHMTGCTSPATHSLAPPLCHVHWQAQTTPS